MDSNPLYGFKSALEKQKGSNYPFEKRSCNYTFEKCKSVVAPKDSMGASPNYPFQKRRNYAFQKCSCNCAFQKGSYYSFVFPV